jgi:uncharacterized small protein (TIGR04563 family)
MKKPSGNAPGGFFISAYLIWRRSTPTNEYISLTDPCMSHSFASVVKGITEPGRENPMNVKSDKRKQSLYFPEKMLNEIAAEATRQDRSLSWIVQKAWKIAKAEISKYPSVTEPDTEMDESEEDDDTVE